MGMVLCQELTKISATLMKEKQNIKQIMDGSYLLSIQKW